MAQKKAPDRTLTARGSSRYKDADGKGTANRRCTSIGARILPIRPPTRRRRAFSPISPASIATRSPRSRLPAAATFNSTKSAGPPVRPGYPNESGNHGRESGLSGRSLYRKPERGCLWSAISPQCGFASTVACNPVTEADQIAKLKLAVNAAEAIWNDGPERLIASG